MDAMLESLARIGPTYLVIALLVAASWITALVVVAVKLLLPRSPRGWYAAGATVASIALAIVMLWTMYLQYAPG